MNSPFNEAKYKALLEGLEATEIRLSQLERTKRIDAEYFRKRFLNLSKILSSKRTQRLNELVSISDGNHFSIAENFTNEGIPYYRGQDVTGHPFIELSSPKYIDEKSFSEPHMRRSHLKQGDVLLSIVGTIGESSLVTTAQPATCSCKLAILRPQKIESNYLSGILQSSYGKSQIERLTRGAIQMGLLLEDMDQVLIPELSEDFKKKISTIIGISQSTIEKSKELQNKAEQTLLSVLGLENWQPTQALSYKRKASDVFAAGRFDAEHFSPKFDQIKAKIKNKGIKTELLSELINPILNGFDIRDFHNSGTPYIRVGDIKDNRINIESAMRINIDISNIKKNISLKVGDILFTRKGSFGNAAPVRNGETKIIISSEIMLIRLKEHSKRYMLPEFLSLFLNTLPAKLQSEQWAHGVAFYSISQEDLNNFWIPIIPITDQKKLVEQIKQQETLLQYAKNLLEAAKRAVEIAIEDSEEVAMQYLQPFMQESDLS